MIKGYYILIFGFIILFFSLFETFSLNKSFYSSIILLWILGVWIIVLGIYYVKGYKNKTFYLANFSLITLFGLISVYNLLFMPSNGIYNYWWLVIFIFLMIISIKSYFQRYKGKLPWKDE